MDFGRDSERREECLVATELSSYFTRENLIPSSPPPRRSNKAIMASERSPMGLMPGMNGIRQLD